MKDKKVIRQLTSAACGHTLHHHGVFSKDSCWIVFDARNEDSKIGESAQIGLLHVATAEQRLLYDLPEASVYGPGVGAASFNPKADSVVFIHGLQGANAQEPYGITRRTAVAVDLNCPMRAMPLDGRDLEAPYTAGTLRGGTHSHAWDCSGKLLSFTYNDALVEPELRMVGVMIPAEITIGTGAIEIQGSMYAALVSEVHAAPQAGTDEISKAFDECWLGDKSVIAFQGNTLNTEGESITEIYTVAIDQKLIKEDLGAIGTVGQRPQPPKGIKQSRLTYSEKGLSSQRHWLRASPDGAFIYALGRDAQQRNQLVRCEVATGDLHYISDFPFSISSAININYQGTALTFVAENQVFIFCLATSSLHQLTDNNMESLALSGAPVFSPNGKYIAFNQYVAAQGTAYLQVMLIYV